MAQDRPTDMDPIPLSNDENRSVNGTETIDLSWLFTQDLTISGSYNVSGIRKTTFGRLLRALPVPALLIDGECRIAFWNEAWEKIAPGYRDTDTYTLLSLFLDDAEAYRMSKCVQKILGDRKPRVRQARLTLDDRTVWAKMYFRSVRMTQERAILVLIEDMTLEKEQLLLLRSIERAKRDWERTFDAVSDLIASIDDQYRIVRLNRAMADKVGIPVQKAAGQYCYKLLHGTDRPPDFCVFRRILAGDREATEEYFEPHVAAYLRETASAVRDDSGNLVGCVLATRDITESKKLEQELRILASHDDLTKLYNRRQFHEMLSSAVESARRYDLPLSVCLLDVDNLKVINDRFGHQAGDEALASVGEIILSELRRADFAGRYGGDEFLIAFPNTSVEGAYECMERIRTRLEGTCFLSAGAACKATCSGGITQFVAGSMTMHELVGNADKALYSAKQAGRNRIVKE